MDQPSRSKDARRNARAALGAVLGVLLMAPGAFAQGPAPDFSVAPNPPNEDQPATFTFQPPPGSGPEAVHWDLDGDGVFEQTAPPNTPVVHTYANPGEVRVRMRPENEGVVEKPITVNAGPSVSFDFEPVSPLPGQEVLFASTIEDPHGVPSQVWAFGDGGTSLDPDSRHRYAVPGTYTVSLTATDSLGATRTETRQLVVRDPSGPTASFTTSPAVPLVGELVTFSSTSEASSGSITALDWDLDDDGEFDDASGTSARRSFPDAGRYTVSLRVQQSNGNAAVRELHLLVVPRPSPSSLLPMAPFPVVRIAGKVLPRATLVRVLSVRAPRGVLARVRCLGRGCPARAVRRRSSGRPLRFRQFQRRLLAGIRLEIFVRSPGTIGKYTRFRIRAGKPPKRIDRCLFPGAKAPRRCP